MRYVIDQGCTITATVMCEMHGHGAHALHGVVREMGQLPSIGTDTTALVAEDMFGEMRGALFALRFQISHEARNAGNYPLKKTPVASREALAWATLGGARALGLEDKIGSITPGKKADLVMLRATDTNLFPVHDPVYAIVELATAANVEHVLIDGQFKKRGGELAYPSNKRDQLHRKVAESASRLMDEAGYRPKAA